MYALTTINPFYAARFDAACHRTPSRCRASSAGAGAAGLRQAAAGAEERQPGAAPDQPLPQRRGRPLRRPRLPRQLRRQPHQGPAAVLQARGLVFDPMSGSGTCPDVCQELGIPCMSWDIHHGLDACDPPDFTRRGNVRLHLGAPALLAAETVRRRPPRPVARADAGAFPPALRPVHPQLRRCPASPAASWRS